MVRSVRSAVAMSDEEEKLTPVKAFLKPLNLGQHRDVMKTLGYDDPTEQDWMNRAPSALVVPMGPATERQEQDRLSDRAADDVFVQP